MSIDPNVLPIPADASCSGNLSTWTYCSRCERTIAHGPRFFVAPVVMRFPAPSERDQIQPDSSPYCPHRKVAR